MTADISLTDFMAACQERVELALEARLPAATKLPERLHQAMRYSVLGGGKRMRPLLTYATGHALGVDRILLDAPACAIEFIHAYSLIHDDLPAMDNDDLRRGKPTCHKAYDEATAILTGDGLQALAFQILAHDPSLQVAAEKRVGMIEALAVASGTCGMVGGQAIDLDAVGTTLDLPSLELMHIRKTGALIRVSVKMAVLAATSVEDRVAQALDHYAKCIGLAFQIQDDILDEESDTTTLGKTQGKDRQNAKPNYPAIIGLAAAKEKAQGLYSEALASLDVLEGKAKLLEELARFIIERRS